MPPRSSSQLDQREKWSSDFFRAMDGFFVGGAQAHWEPGDRPGTPQGRASPAAVRLTGSANHTRRRRPLLSGDKTNSEHLLTGPLRSCLTALLHAVPKVAIERPE